MNKHADLLQTASTHHQAGRLDDAEKAYRKLLRQDAVNGDVQRLLGALYLQSGRLAKAIEHLEKAVRLRPGDAETLTNLGLALRGVGRFDEAIDCYRRALAAQPDYLSALQNLGGLLHERGTFSEALVVYGEALRLYPDHAAAHYNYGNSLFATGRIGDAVARYEHALKLKPDYLEAMINLGMALAQAGKAGQSLQWLGLARSWFEKALQADPDNVVAMNNLANILRQEDRPAEAVDYYRKALKIRPAYADAAINLATSLRDLGRVDEAIAACRQALAAQPASANARINLGVLLQDKSLHAEAIAQFSEALALQPASLDARWNKSLSLLSLGHYSEGWPLHEVGLGITHMRGENPSPERRWTGENFAGKRLLLWCEQGLGDSLQFIRYAELCKARGGQVIVLCPRPLRSLFSRCPFIDALPEAVEEKDFDMHAPLMSLPLIFGTQLDSIPARMPYLRIGEAAQARFAAAMPATKGLRVGLVWAGNPRPDQFNAHLTDRRCSLPLATLLPLFDLPGVDFINLQKGDAAGQIAQLNLQNRVFDPMPQVENFEDTGALIEQLDLVISVDTSVAHLAGALNKPVWILSRFDACWRWLQNRPDSPWYPAARIFGQPQPGDWDGVVAQVKAELAQRSAKA